MVLEVLEVLLEVLEVILEVLDVVLEVLEVVLESLGVDSRLRFLIPTIWECLVCLKHGLEAHKCTRETGQHMSSFLAITRRQALR